MLLGNGDADDVVLLIVLVGGCGIRLMGRGGRVGTVVCSLVVMMASPIRLLMANCTLTIALGGDGGSRGVTAVALVLALGFNLLMAPRRLLLLLLPTLPLSLLVLLLWLLLLLLLLLRSLLLLLQRLLSLLFDHIINPLTASPQSHSAPHHNQPPGRSPVAPASCTALWYPQVIRDSADRG